MKKILLFLLTFLACTYSAQAQDYVYLIGSCNSWTRPSEENASTLDSWKLAKSGDVYVGTFSLTGEVQFRFYSGLGTANNNDDWNGDRSWGPEVAMQGKDITLGTEYVINQRWQNQWVLQAGSETASYTFTVDLTNKKMKVVKDGTTPDPEPTYPKIWLRGAWTSDWKTEDAYEFKTTDGVTYTLTDVNGATVKGKQWQIAKSDWSYKYGSSSKISAEGTYTLEWDKNQGFDSSFSDGTYDLEYNYNTHVLKVTKQGTTPDPDPEYPEKIYYYFSSSSDMLEIAAKDQANGVYEATLTIAENASFRFYSNSNKADAYSYGPNTPVDGSGKNYEAYTLGEKRGMTLTSTNRWQLTNTAGEYTFTVDLKNKTFTVVAKSVEYTKYYLRGDMNGWASPEVGDDTWELKTTDGLTYTLNNVTLVSGQQFKIGQAGESGWVGYCYGETDGQKAIYPDGSEYKIYKDNSGNLKFDYVYDRPVNITFTLASIDSNEATLKVVYVDGAEITYPELYLRGNFSGESWATNDAYKFTKSGDVYTLTGVDGATVKGNQWQIADGAWTYKFGSSSKISAEGTYTLAWNNNQGFDSSFPDGIYDLEYTYSTQTLKVTKQGAVVTYPDLWLRGGFNNWGNDGPEANTKYKFTCTGGVYTLNDVALSNTQFKIGSYETKNGVDWKYGFGGATVAADENDVMSVNAGEPCTIYNVEHGKNLYIGELTYHVDITFTPNKDFTEGTLKITLLDTSGINDVEIFDEAPVEFYNLQGVRVDGELTPGLYIRRQGNSASKVLIR